MHRTLARAASPAFPQHDAALSRLPLCMRLTARLAQLAGVLSARLTPSWHMSRLACLHRRGGGGDGGRPEGKEGHVACLEDGQPFG